MKGYYVYILASKRNGTLYTGVTNRLKRRVYEHKEGNIQGFTAKYNVKELIYFEITSDIKSVIGREKQMKKKEKRWKLDLIETINSSWEDLYYNL